MWDWVKRFKKFVIYFGITLGLSAILGVTSRISVGFSEFWASRVYPVFAATVGRFFGIFPFSVGEILLIAIIAGFVPFVVIVIVKRKKILTKSLLGIACAGSTLLLIYTANCGVMYNRQIFLSDEKYGFGRDYSFEKVEEEYELKEWIVILTILSELYESEVYSKISTDENGVFKPTRDLAVTAPAAMRNLAKTYPRLNVYFPRPKPLTRLTSEIMTAGWTVGVFSPFTIEANYNNIVPYNERAVTALHELAHAAGFMREEEANFIAFLAAMKSGDSELEYAAYLDIFYSYRWWIISIETYEALPKEYQDLFDTLARKDEWDFSFEGEEIEYSPTYFSVNELLPSQVQLDLQADNDFWWNRYYNVEYVYDEEGEIIDEIITEDPWVGIVSDITSGVNDAYLKAQGQSDGVLSYGRMTDLVIAWYWAGI